MIDRAIKKVVDKIDLTADESRAVMQEIMSGRASDVQKAAYLAALRLKGETADEIFGAALVMREKVCRINHHQEKIFDNCGTGGDGAGTFNISTTTSFILAACGLKMGKHGNRSVSSRCGSADLLQHLGADITLGPDQMARCIDEVGIGFLFAPTLHPAMKEVMPVRRELGIRTIFNILGPLTNPAFATHQMIGVFDADYVKKLATAAAKLGIKKVGVVYNRNRIDELTTAGINEICIAHNGTLDYHLLKPQDHGFEECDPDDLKGGTIEENAEITKSILNGDKNPRRDTVLLNAAVALTIAEVTGEIKEGIKISAEAIDSGRACEKLTDFIEFTRSVADA